MAKSKPGAKGYELEEVLRSYFLTAGYFVLRGVPLRFEDEDVTDVDLWLYERPTGSARRRQIVDAKFKAKPKAFERLLWTIGLAEALGVDDAYVATTDERRTLRRAAKRLGVSIIDGADLKRITKSPSVKNDQRLTEEQFAHSFQELDRAHNSKEYSRAYRELKSDVLDRFGAQLIVTGLKHFETFARVTATSHPNSEAAIASGRLAYFAAAITGVALDYVGVEEPFRTAEEREVLFVNSVRYGSTDEVFGTERLRLALALTRQYSDNGAATAAQIEAGLTKTWKSIPAEIVAEQAVKMSKDGGLFDAARNLENAAFSLTCPSFDDLGTKEKSILGSFLDFADIERGRFAAAWTTTPKVNSTQLDSKSLGLFTLLD